MGEQIQEEVKEVAEEEVKETDTENKELYADGWSGEIVDTDKIVPYDAKTFEDYDESVKAKQSATKVEEDSFVLKRLIDNALHSSEVTDKVTAIKDLASKFADRIGNAFNKNKEITEHIKHEETIVWSDQETKDETKEILPFMIFKDKDDNYRFLTTYSNNGRDSDNPPEIISAASHANFVKMVDEGNAELPELWLWHKNIVLGQATAIAFDEDNGIAIATGYFKKEAEPFAEAMLKNPSFWGVSHGMPKDSIVRNKEDDSIIEQHITKEISILPLASAANKWADLHILKEISMSLEQDKQDQLIQAGVPVGILGALLDGNKEVSEEMDAVGIERKEETPTPAEETLVEAKADADVDVPVEAKEDKEVKEVKEVPAFTEDQVQELGGALASMLPAIVQQTVAQIEPVLKEIHEELSVQRKSIEEGFEGHIKQLPPKTLGAYMEGAAIFKSASEDESTKIDGRSKLKQDGPEEAKDEKSMTVQTGNPLMDPVFSSILDGTPLNELTD